MDKLETKELIEKIKKNITLHLNPYNLGDMGETTELINDALGRLEKLVSSINSMQMAMIKYVKNMEKEMEDNPKDYSLMVYKAGYQVAVDQFNNRLKKYITTT